MKLSLIVLLVGCAYIQIVRKDYTESTRYKIAVICLCWLPASLVLLNFRELFPIIITLNKFLIFINCCCIILLLSLYQSIYNLSAVQKWILFFWIYMLISSFWADTWLPIFSGKLSACLTFISGMALGQYIITRRKVSIAIKILMCAGVFLLSVFYIFGLSKLSGTMQVEQAGFTRIGSPEIVNSNTISMVFVPFAVISLILINNPISVGDQKISIIWKITGAGICLFAGYLLIRTGSRSSFLSLCVSAIVIFSFIARNWLSRILMILILLILFSLFIINNPTGLRVFNIITRLDVTSLEGRATEFESAIKSLSGFQHITGSGGIVRSAGGAPYWGGYLSIYITVYQAAGIIGITLLAGFIFSTIREVFYSGKAAMPSAAIISMILVYGLGESGPIRPFNIQCLFFGIGVGLLPQQNKNNTKNNLHNRQNKRYLS